MKHGSRLRRPTSMISLIIPNFHLHL